MYKNLFSRLCLSTTYNQGDYMINSTSTYSVDFASFVYTVFDTKAALKTQFAVNKQTLEQELNTNTHLGARFVK